jgi:putative endopeptidase
MRSLLTLAFACVLLFALPAAAQSAPHLSHFDPMQADRNLDPCQDFFQYSCSKWISANPIPNDQVYWTTASGLRLWNENVLRETLERAAADTANRSRLEHQIGDYWAACMDETGMDARGVRDLTTELDRIAKLRSKADLIEAVAHLHQTLPGAAQQGNNQTQAPLFGFTALQDYGDASLVVAGFDQGGMTLPGRDFYLKDDARSVELRGQYQEHIRKMLELAGEASSQTAGDAVIVLTLETALAKAAMDNVARRDPKNVNNPMTLEQVQALTPSLDWKRYLQLVGAPAPKHYLVSAPSFFRSLEELLQQHPLEHWQTYLRWQVIHYSAAFMAQPFADENFDFFARKLSGAKEQVPRWRRCVRNADRDLGEALGKAYVDRAFPPESKRRMLELVRDIENALDRNINTLEWMSPATKQQAKKKLRAIEEKIGYPSQWRDYSSVKITRASLLENVRQSSGFEFSRQLQKVGKPVDRAEWGMTPPTINAYYDPQLNTINFPAGILQPPFFDSLRDAAVNYAGIGSVIGHEIIHGFDDQGRKFDADGNLRDWWTPEDGKAYDARGKCIADEYTQDVPDAGVKQNGLLTQGEDTADNGGVRLALAALEAKLKRDGKTLDDKGTDGWTNRQRFYLAYGNVWCAQARPEILRVLVLTNPHSFSRYRVNNVVTNQPEFSQAFGCKKGQPMARENACRVW